MTASRAKVPDRAYRPRAGAQAKVTQPKAPKRSARPVSTLPSNYPVPRWFRFLLFTQRVSIAGTIILTLCVFGIYSWTVYAKEQWNDQYRKLEQLKRYERQLTSAEATFKHDLTKNAQKLPERLVQERPQQSLFVEASPTRPNRTPEAGLDPSSEVGASREPVGY